MTLSVEDLGGFQPINAQIAMSVIGSMTLSMENLGGFQSVSMLKSLYPLLVELTWMNDDRLPFKASRMLCNMDKRS